MKKKISILLVILLMSSIRSVYATTFSNFLPGGKNYLDESNFVVTTNSISTNNSFLVKESTFYTLSFPGSDRIGSNITVEIVGNEIYFNGNVSADPYCTFTEQESYCTFETVPGEDYISVIIGSSNIGNYYNYYGFYGFQLEEGTTPTSYEEYIAPDIDEDHPEFSGSGAYIKSYNTFETVQNIIDEHISVIDEVEGDISNNIIIISDTYTGNENIVGDYLVELSASDSSGNTAYFNLNILVKDEIPPIITGPNSVELNVFEAASLMSIINETYSIEDEYSNTTINILVDNYTLGKDTIGTYTVNFEAVDENLNSTTQTFQIVVVDNEVPTVTSNLEIDSYLSDPYDLDDVLNTLEFSDNYTDMVGANVSVISNGFIGNMNIPGTYIINFEVNDESGNLLNSNLTVNVIDDIDPQIGGPLTYQGSYTEELVLNDFLNMMSVSDNVNIISLNDVYITEDTYSNRSSITGSYIISFGISDENSNESVHTINITLFDDVAPIIYVDNFIVTVDMSSTFTTEDAIALLINSEELIEGSYSVRTLFDEYTGNETVEGTYLYTLEFTDDEGESYEKEFVVKVINDDSDFDKGLLIRNVIVYSMSSALFGFVIYKNKK
jgi:hypothetical protein